MLFAEDILQFEIFDLEKVKTPVHAQVFNDLLTQSLYDRDETAFLIDGFMNGFSIGYEGPQMLGLNLLT